MTWLTGFIQVLFLERNSSPSVLWWWALTALAGWKRSETSVVGVEEGGDPWKILLDNIASEVEVSSLADVSKD